MELKEYYNGKKLSAHAFFGCSDLKSIKLLEETTEIGDYAFSECRKLREIRLPKYVKRIGNHAFYNCRGLKRFILPGSLIEIEEGAFKNCDGLEQIIIEYAHMKHLNVRKILHEVTQRVEILLLKDSILEEKELLEKKSVLEKERVLEKELILEKQNILEESFHCNPLADLIFPAYHYEYEANEPARIFSEISYGSGFYYRECFKREEPNLQEYDSYFPIAIREESFETVLKIAQGRILYPYQLQENDRVKYMEWIKKEIEKVTEYYIRQEQTNLFIHLLKTMGCNVELVNTVIERAVKIGKAESIGMLMEYQHQAFQKQEESYEL